MMMPKFHLKYNRAGLGCLLFFIGTPLALLLFWRLAPSSWILRFELQNQMGRMAYDTSRSAGPEAVPVLQEYLAHQNPGTRIMTINATGAYIGSHQGSSQSLITTLCQLAQHDASLSVQQHSITALRSVSGTSTEVDLTAVKLMHHQSEAIRREAKELLLIRIIRGIDLSPEVCTVREQLRPALDRADPEGCAAKILKAFLEECGPAQNE
ncbi:HEAT repeat domain-containing protein [Gimesia panareensis]|uniref:Uncharacterized protein n=1 Tax=Gimesia panareensis TaxID=2527978 RepID=A0A517PZH5_9PLAN|nr:HEAT repeat domain-containing protein [Gimesia panareensis]QDT24757.1 hypothetical protein Enr10x_00470 [Gimesia panareensis]QDU47738.1 hypothetical protein Pan110_00480 [Gimesia panareensis]